MESGSIEDYGTTMIPYAKVYNSSEFENNMAVLEAAAWDDEYYNSIDEALDAVFQGNGKGQLCYYNNAEKEGKSTNYYLNDDFKLYVNGVEIEATEDDVETYIFSNKTGKIKLIDETSDGKYDEIHTSYYATAILDSVSESGIAYFDATANTGSNSTNMQEKKNSPC